MHKCVQQPTNKRYHVSQPPLRSQVKKNHPSETTVAGKERKEAEHAQNDDEEDEDGVTGNDDADREKQSMSSVITLDRI